MKRNIMCSCLYLSLSMLLMGCNGTNSEGGGSEEFAETEKLVIADALEKGQLAVKNGEFEVAENSFRLILNDNDQHKEATDWLAFTEQCQELEDKLENNEVAEVKELYASLQTHPYASAIETQFKQIEQNPANTYENKVLGFTFDYPESWIGRLQISDSKEGFYSNEEIDFIYVNPAKGIEEFVFSIVIYDEILTESEWPMQQYLADDGEKTYALVLSGEPTVVLLREENEEDLQFVQKMLEEVEMIMTTFKLEGEKGQSKELYNNYTNILFDFTLEYPSSLTMNKGQIKGEGAHLYHNDFDLNVFGDYIEVGKTAINYYEADLVGIEGVIHQQIDEDMYIISYEEDGAITYIKSVFNEEAFSKLTITYPTRQQEKYATWETKISDSFYIIGH